MLVENLEHERKEPRVITALLRPLFDHDKINLPLTMVSDCAISRDLCKLMIIV